jgi:hypothetical protein
MEKLREEKIFIPGDSVFVKVPIINCPDQELYEYENDKLKQRVRILNGQLESETNIKPDTIKVTVTETVTTIKEITKPIEVLFVPLWAKILSKLGIISTFALIGLIWLKIR